MKNITKINKISPSIQTENNREDDKDKRASSPDPIHTTLNLVNEMNNNKHKFIENNKKIERSLTKKINELKEKIESYQIKINLCRQNIDKYNELINKNYKQVDDSKFCSIL